MAQLVLLVVAAAWAAVLIPPMLRSRVENHPNSSVTDFRRQLNTLQSSSTPARGTLRGMGRPLAQSPLHRPAAAGRPGQSMHRQASLHSGSNAPHQAGPGSRPSHGGAPTPSNQQFRSHGDPSGGQHRPHRQTHMPRQGDPRNDVKRRRTNVLFVLVVATACSMFLAATTGSTALLYVFALAFLSLCGYVYLLAQLRQREQVASNGPGHHAGNYTPQYQPQYTGQVQGQPYTRADPR
jgi:hypothetical protein